MTPVPGEAGRSSTTPAASLPDPVSPAEKQARFDVLLRAQNRISEEKHLMYVGTDQRVLVDGHSGDEKFPLTARTNGGRLVHLAGDETLIGSFVFDVMP